MFKDENRHYSLRKLSVGLASVLIGISFASVKANTAYADSLKPGSAQTEVANQKASNTNQDTTNSSKPETKVENAQKQATATNEMVNKKQDDQVSRPVNEVNSTASPEKPKVGATKPDANAQTKQRAEQTENTLQIKPAKNTEPNALKQNLAAEEPESETVVKTRNDIDQNKLSASKWQFTDADDNNKAIAGSTIIIGNSGDTFTKDQITLPKGYEDRNDLLGKNADALKLPAAGTITTYTLPLSHHHTDLTKQAPEDEVKQTRTVTVHYKYLDGDKANQEAAPDAKLDVYYSRNKFKDDVTGEISYTHWSWDNSRGDQGHPGYHIVSGKWDNLPEQWDNVIANVPTIAGYIAVLDEPNRPDNINHVNANKFVHPLWNNSLSSGMTDINKDSLAYLATNTLYEAKNEHTVYYKANDSNTNDAFALDSKNGLHEHANVNDNGGYDTDFWGKINVDDWNYTVNGDRIEINGLKDGVSTGANDAVIVPNLDDFKLAGKDDGAKTVYISKNTLSKTANHKYYGLSKTNGNKFVTNSDLNNVFDNSKLTYADLNSLNTNNVTNISNMFNSAWDLTSLDVSKWDTSKVTDMSSMFNGASRLTSLDVSNWNTGKVTDMSNMFAGTSGLTSLDVSKWDTGNVTSMCGMFSGTSSLTSLDVSHWDTSNVTNMSSMFDGASSLRSLDVSKWNTGKVTDMSKMFEDASILMSLDVSKWNTGNVNNMSSMFSNAHNLTSLAVSNWKTGKVTDMSGMFNGASSLTSLDVSKWNTGNVTSMSEMFFGATSLTSLDVLNWDTSKDYFMDEMFFYATSLTHLDVSNWNTDHIASMNFMFNHNSNLALIVNGNKFADYLVKNHFSDSNINSMFMPSVKSVTTDNAKLLKLLTNDVQHNSATRTIVFTFPANYSFDLAKYHLTKTGNTYQIKQSADYDTSYAQGTVLINATDDITKHHIDTTKPYKLSDTWQPNYDKLVLAHKNSDGTVSFDKVQLPKVPGYKAVIKTLANPVNPANVRFAVSFIALPKHATPASNDTKPAKTVTTPVTTEMAEPVEIDSKATTSVTPKVIDLSDDAVAATPDMSTWEVANKSDQDTYHVSNGQYAVELPHISNAQLHVIANDSTKDSVLFTYKGQNAKYIFNIKFINGHYLLTIYKIKSGKLIKLINYNFIKSSKLSDVILDWLNL